MAPHKVPRMLAGLLPGGAERSALACHRSLGCRAPVAARHAAPLPWTTRLRGCRSRNAWPGKESAKADNENEQLHLQVSGGPQRPVCTLFRVASGSVATQAARKYVDPLTDLISHKLVKLCALQTP